MMPARRPHLSRCLTMLLPAACLLLLLLLSCAATNASIAALVDNSLSVLPLRTDKQPGEKKAPNDYKFRADTSSTNWLIGPLVQSGGRGNVHVDKAMTAGPDGTPVRVVSSDDPMKADVVHYSAVMYDQSAVAGIARTYLVGPSPSQIKVYDAILEAQTMLIDGLRPGAVIGTVSGAQAGEEHGEPAVAAAVAAAGATAHTRSPPPASS